MNKFLETFFFFVCILNKILKMCAMKRFLKKEKINYWEQRVGTKGPLIKIAQEQKKKKTYTTNLPPGNNTILNS